MAKVIGTLVPMSALGTFEDGIVFLDWLKKTNQSAWQVLPLYETQLELGSATRHIPSPYKSYGVGLDPKYLPKSFLKRYPTVKEIHAFIAENKDWIHDYAFFCALRDHFKTDDWRKWDADLKIRNPKALSLWTEKLSKKINAHILTQWQLHMSYQKLRRKAKEFGIALIGDLSFYVSLQSPLVWTNQNVFQIEKDGSMLYVSGVPDGANASLGRQVWGHPLYNWEVESQHKGIRIFWKMRLVYMSKLFDFVRLDYARGFFQYGAIDIKSKDGDTFKKGPGEQFFADIIAFNHRNGVVSFAEDSGKNLEQIQLWMKKLHIPGVKIFRFGIYSKKGTINEEHINPTLYPANTVAYTTMHDTVTLLGYLHILTPEQKQTLAAHSHVSYDVDDKILAERLRFAVVHSPANTVIIPIQDWLLTTDRINVPGTERSVGDPNWQYRLKIPIEQLPIQF